jgi:hypothetical protein
LIYLKLPHQEAVFYETFDVADRLDDSYIVSLVSTRLQAFPSIGNAYSE